jgi:hypothetical protein
MLLIHLQCMSLQLPGKNFVEIAHLLGLMSNALSLRNAIVVSLGLSDSRLHQWFLWNIPCHPAVHPRLSSDSNIVSQFLVGLASYVVRQTQAVYWD